MNQNLLYPKQAKTLFCSRKAPIKGNWKENRADIDIKAPFIYLKKSRKVIFSTKPEML